MTTVAYEKLEDYGVEFKNIISAPAPVGRILNYVILTGQGVLYHKNGFRETGLRGNIASAWCSEFMVGLGLVRYIETNSGIFPLYLTKDGKRLYTLIRNYPGQFDESIDPTICREELLNYSKEAYTLFEDIFKSSIICRNLVKYIINNDSNAFKKDSFYNDYFELFKSLYDKSNDASSYNRDARTTTGDNRMPSLTQICQFFGFLSVQSIHEVQYFVFDIDALQRNATHYQFIPITPEKEQELKTEYKKQEILEEELIKKYGIDGTVLHEIISRNSGIQQIFRNNLIAQHGKKCVLCNKDLDEVLIASHIKPAAKSNVIEKADYENGFLLCALHDKLFDRHLISFDANTGKILIADELLDHLDEYQLDPNFSLDESFMTEKRKGYLSHHNTEFYNRKNN